MLPPIHTLAAVFKVVDLQSFAEGILENAYSLHVAVELLRRALVQDILVGCTGNLAVDVEGLDERRRGKEASILSKREIEAMHRKWQDFAESPAAAHVMAGRTQLPIMQHRQQA
jgi:hypothetical protein